MTERRNNTGERTLGRLEGLVETIGIKVEHLNGNFSMIQKALARQGMLLETLPCNDHHSRISGLVRKLDRIANNNLTARAGFSAGWKVIVVIASSLVAGGGLALALFQALR
jgi:hypothetical protein